MGSTKVNVPGPTAEEIEIQKIQLDLLRQSRADEKALRPFVLQSLRLVEQPGAEGAPAILRRMTDEEFLTSLSPSERASEENLRLAQEREAKALRGELPLTESGQRQKREEFASFKEAMARAGNPITGDTPESATATTTAGIQGLRAFNERFGLLEEAERRGELTGGTQAVLARLGVTSDIGARRTGMLTGFPTTSLALAQGAGTLLQPYQQQRALEFQAAQQTAANRAATQAALIGAAGQIVGTAGGLGAIKLLSGRRYKKDIALATKRQEEEALEMVQDLTTRTYRYKWEGRNTPKRFGLLADEAPESIVTPDRQGLDVGRLVGMLTSATRALARRVDGGR